jgi:hypothetical protein
VTPHQKENVEAVAGLTSAWTAAGVAKWIADPLDSIAIHSWADLASAGAAVYTVLLILFFVWKRVIKPLFRAIRASKSSTQHTETTDSGDTA